MACASPPAPQSQNIDEDIDLDDYREEFVLGGKPYRLELCKESLQYTQITKKNTSSVLTENIIACSPAKPFEKFPYGIKLDYVVKHPKGIWKLSCLSFYHLKEETCTSWIRKLKHYLEGIEERPRSLLVFINPISGRKKGLQNFEKVAPIFKLANIQTEIIVTKSGDHAPEVIQSYNLHSIDGIVIVGGDGTFTQIITALMKRIATEAGLDYNVPNIILPECQLRIGIIPAGTGQGMVKLATGTYDPLTSALHIISGTSQPIDVGGAFNAGHLVGYFSMLAGFGWLGEMIHDSETHRNLGIARYPYAMVRSIMKNSHLNADAHYMPDNSDGDREWREIKGPFQSLSLWLFRAESFLNYTSYLNALDVIAVKPCGRIKHLSAWKSALSNSYNMNISNVERIHTNALKVTNKDFAKKQNDSALAETSHSATNQQSSNPSSENLHHHFQILNLDGDPHYLYEPEIEIRLYIKVLHLFGCGVKKAMV